MKVLIACEFSGVVRRAFRALGHDAWSCDLLPAEDGDSHHYQQDVLTLLAGKPITVPVKTGRLIPDGFGKNADYADEIDYEIEREPWDLMIAHPPCTYLSRSGWHWVNKPDHDTHPLKGEPRRRAAVAAAAFFMRLLEAPIARVAVENPKPICHVNLPPATQAIQPWQFGHGEVKETFLWLRGVAPLVPTDVVAGREAKVHRMSPGANRSKERSRTYPGIAAAMAAQWGGTAITQPPLTLDPRSPEGA